jgi:hypothetical protein
LGRTGFTPAAENNYEPFAKSFIFSAKNGIINGRVFCGFDFGRHGGGTAKKMSEVSR